MNDLNKDDKMNSFYSDNKILEEIELHGSRKIIADRLRESYQNKVHATMYRYIEIEKLKEYKDKIKKGSIIDHFIRAVALTLKEKPGLNATYDGKVYKIYRDVNICYAVSTKRGLVAPVLKNVDTLSLNEFLEDKSRVINMVLEWKHELKDLMGGTFTITNMGNFKVDFTLPIINPPQVAILGISRICKLNISWDDTPPRTRELMPVSITYDHSVIDGVGVAQFAQTLQDKIDNPKNLWD